MGKDYLGSSCGLGRLRLSMNPLWIKDWAWFSKKTVDLESWETRFRLWGLKTDDREP